MNLSSSMQFDSNIESLVLWVRSKIMGSANNMVQECKSIEVLENWSVGRNIDRGVKTALDKIMLRSFVR